jgi:aryl-alcohol dehydrogenase-like predicted oxidoreductase
MKRSTSMNRRSFLKKGTSGLAGMALLPGLSLKDRPRYNKSESTIITRELGLTGFRIPAVNMGVMNADNPAVMKSAYDMGIRLFDTAWRYQNGRNEKMVGEVIKEMGIRDKIVLATKVPLAFGNHSSYTIPEIEELRKKEGSGLEKKPKEKGLGIVAMKTQAIYSTHRTTHHTAALKYVLQNDFITTAIPGFTTFAQLKALFA